MAKKRYSKEFRAFAIERMRSCENIVALAKELHVSRRQLYRWRDQADAEMAGMETPGQNEGASQTGARADQSSKSGEKASTHKTGR